MIIRPLGPDELTQVAHWIFDEWGASVPGLTIEKLVQQFEPRIGSERVPLTLVALDAGELVGTASLVATEMSTHPELSPWLSCVYVRSDRRGSGLGDLLCRRILDEARRLGFPNCYLIADTQIGFYARRGWKVRSNETYRGDAVSLMEIAI